MLEEFSNYYVPKARKFHTCTSCGGAIRPGDVYHKWTGREDGEWFHTKWCGFCRPQCPTTSVLVEFNWYTPHQWAWRVREQREDADAPLYMAGYKLPPAHGQDQERVQYVAHKTADGWGPWELEEDLEDSPQEAALERRERIFEAIDLERLRQDDKWGGPDHLPRDWTTLLHRHAARAERRASVDGGAPDLEGYAESMLAVAALAVAALESLEVEVGCSLIGPQAERAERPSCSRTVCNNPAHPDCIHRDLHQAYCVRCAKRINRANRLELVSLPEEG